MTPMTSRQDSLAVTLRPVVESDLPFLLAWINDPRIAEPFLFVGPVSQDDHRRWFARQAGEPSEASYVVTDSRDHPVGVFNFKEINAAHRTADLSLYIDPAAWGRGFGQAALEAGLRIGFDEFRLRKIHLRVRRENATAIRLYERAGFVQEGVLTADMLYDGQEIDIVRMALVDSAWRSHRKLGRRVALMQPAFLPWLGFFELLASTDRLVLLDDFQVSRQSHSQRNRLFLSPGRSGFLTLPIAHRGDLNGTFQQIDVAADDRWWRKTRTSLQQTYGRAPFFAEVMAMVEPILAHPTGSLAAVDAALIRVMAQRLQLTAEIKLSSETPSADLKRSARVLHLLRQHDARVYYAARGSYGYMVEDGLFPTPSITVLFQDFEPRPYRQVGALAFEPRLSALDALFNLSPDQCRRVLFGTRKWLRWDEMPAVQAAHADDGS